MSTHQILETLIRHTTFRTEAEQHALLDLLDESVEHDDPAEGAIARTAWQTPVPRDASGQPIRVPTGMTSQQADELISLLKSQQAVSTDTVGQGIEPASDLPPTVSPADVPEGVK